MGTQGGTGLAEAHSGPTPRGFTLGHLCRAAPCQHQSQMQHCLSGGGRLGREHSRPKKADRTEGWSMLLSQGTANKGVHTGGSAW